MGGGRARVEAHRRRAPHLDRSRHEERRRARAVPARIRLSDRLARAGQCRPRYRPLHAGAGNRSSICAGLRRARPCLLAEVRGKQRSAMAIEGARGVPHSARNRPAPLGRACVPGNGIERLGSIRRGEGGLQEGARVQRAQRRRATGACICRRTLGRPQRGRTDVPTCGGTPAALLGESLVARDLLSRTGSIPGGRRAVPASRRAHTRQRERMDVPRYHLSLYGPLPRTPRPRIADRWRWPRRSMPIRRSA